MKEADFISKVKTGDSDLEFSNLREIGIEEIQRLAGNKWTDYNIHDPGVTILEQLCYAITELGYKTQFDLKDLLASQQYVGNINDTFFHPELILQGKPVTINDFRKLLIDRIDGLRDVWLVPLNLTTATNHIKGTYLVLIKPSPVIIKNKKDQDKLIKDTRECLEKHSNLAEAFDEIVILEEDEIFVAAEIETDSEANVDWVHAQVLFQIQKFISHPIRFYSLEEMIADGHAQEEIFNGPRLFNGFIKNEELTAKVSTLYTSQLVNVVSKIEGVSKVRFMKLGKSTFDKNSHKKDMDIHNHHHTDILGKSNMAEGVMIEMNKVAVLAKAMLPFNEEANDSISYYQNHVKVNLFKKNVNRYLRLLENEEKIVYNQTFSEIHDDWLITGTRKPINEYFSIQEDFPAIYALGSGGIPPHYDKNKIAQVNQLKSYLSLFEQVLTNYLSQLSNFSNLFSLDEDLSQTYFAGSLASIPGIKNLLFGLNNSLNKKETEKLSLQISRTVLEAIDDFNTRRHQALDHLLARFGESISNFGISKFNYYHDDESHQKRMLKSKIHFLKNIINQTEKEDTAEQPTNKNRQFNENLKNIERRVKIRLGIESQSENFTNHLKTKIGSYKKNQQSTLNSLTKYLFWGNRVRSELMINSVPDSHQNIKNFIPDIEIDSDLLKRGIWPDNYKILTIKGDKEVNFVAFSKKLRSNSFTEAELKAINDCLEDASDGLKEKPNYIRFWNSHESERNLLIEFQRRDANHYHPVPSNVWGIIKKTRTKTEAASFASSLINYLREININSEGFYLIDHIELRPRYESNRYGIILKDQENKTGFISAEHFYYHEIQDELIKLISQARKADFVHETTASKELKTRLVYKGKTIGYHNNLGVSNISDQNKRESELKKIFDSLSDFELHDPSLIQFYAPRHDDEMVNSGQFYSFRISVVVPGWSARFSDTEFRKVLESIIREEVPAHIGIDFFYLDFKELSQFETLYERWIENTETKHSVNLDKLNQSSYDLAMFIKNLKEEDSQDEFLYVQ